MFYSPLDHAQPQNSLPAIICGVRLLYFLHFLLSSFELCLQLQLETFMFIHLKVCFICFLHMLCFFHLFSIVWQFISIYTSHIFVFICVCVYKNIIYIYKYIVLYIYILYFQIHPPLGALLHLEPLITMIYICVFVWIQM